MSVSVTNSKILLPNTAIELVVNAATADVADTAEVFTITLDRADHKAVMTVVNASADTALAVSVAAGDLWAATTALTFSVPAAKEYVVELEGGKDAQDNGTILVTLTPGSGKKLLTDHAAEVKYIETI